MASILTDETLYQNRNCKQLHDEALHISKKRHDQVHDNAVAALRLHELRLEQDQAKQLADQAEALLEAKRAKAAEEIRIRKAENAVKLIPQPPPRVPTPPPQQPTPETTVNKPAPAPQSNHATPPQPSLTSQQPAKQPQQQPGRESTQNIASSAAQSGQATPVAQPQAPQATPRRPSLLNSTTQHTIPNTAHVPLNPELVKHTGIDPTVAGLEHIHQTCKKMRQYLKTQPKEFIKHAGDMRRKIKMTLGQLLEQGGNKAQVRPYLLSTFSS
jgi:nucleoporin GLE1